MEDFGGNSSRARNPIQGLRQKLRTELRACGYKGKFRTDIRRDGAMLVMGKGIAKLPFEEFEGRKVIAISVLSEL